MILELMAKSENVGFARQAVAIFASQLDFTVDEIDEIRVAISEAVSNAIIHGYAGEGGMVRIEAALHEETLAVSVQDRGRGIENIAWAMEPAHTSQPDERMGLGLVFVKEYMDDMRIESSQGVGTTVHMSKKACAKRVSH